jgi:hypothetical protein
MMSVRYLYKAIPVAKRSCSWPPCSKSVVRNLFRTKDGRLWHYGCLNIALDTHYECLECFSSFDGTETSFEIKQFLDGEYMAERLRPICPYCGSVNVKGLSQVGVIET